MLLLDIGNTRLKWRLLQAGAPALEGAILIGDITPSIWSDLPVPDQVFACCVASPAVQEQINQLCCTRWQLPVEWLKVSTNCAGVRNHYDVDKLGPDRWAAVIAAYQRIQACCIVVSAGTAITVDAVNSDGDYLGGVIIPGLRLMRDALATQTARLPSGTGIYSEFPQQTLDAIYTGAIDAACGAVERLARRLGGVPSCVLSGGDAPLLVERLQLKVVTVENLVLEGLQVIKQ